MSKLDSHDEILQLARDLGIPPNGQPVNAMIQFCIQKMRPWIPKRVVSIQEVEELVCKKLEVRLVEVWSDEELTELIKKYVLLGDAVFANIRNSLNNATFAELLQRMHTSEEAPERYVAVIDCRTSAKAARRFFTKWHEIAHLLTKTPQMTLPVFRSSVDEEKQPTETLMDMIAGEVGFWDPIFIPLVEDEITREGRLTLEGIRRIKEAYHSDASFQATAIAAVKRSSVPTIYLTGQEAYKVAERRALTSNQGDLFPTPPPAPKLRVRDVTNSASAKSTNLALHPNMRIPTTSVIAEVFRDSLGFPQQRSENLGDWDASGKSLPAVKIFVEAWSWEGTVHAIVTLA